MHLLKLDYVIQNLCNYQSHLDEILKDPQLYYQRVEGAEICFSCISQQKIYLGDLLQLWQQKVWQKCLSQQFPHQKCENAYIFAITCNTLKKRIVISAYVNQEHVIFNINNALDFYLAFIRLNRP